MINKFIAIPTIVFGFTVMASPYVDAHEIRQQMSIMESSSKATQAPFDLQFLDAMSEHHRNGIALMDLAIKKTKNPKIKTMSQMMRDE